MPLQSSVSLHVSGCNPLYFLYVLFMEEIYSYETCWTQALHPCNAAPQVCAKHKQAPGISDRLKLTKNALNTGRGLFAFVSSTIS